MGRLAIQWRTDRDIPVQLHHLLASLGLVWSPGSVLVRAIASIMDSVCARYAVAKDHPTKMVLKIDVTRQRLWCYGRLGMSLSYGNVDLRRSW